MKTAKAKPTLDDLTAEANDAHAQVIGAARQMIQYAKKAGNALRQIRRKLNHGEFTRWIEENFAASYETASVYMRVSKKWNRLQPLLRSNSDLSLEAALKHLRVPRKKEDTHALAVKEAKQQLLNILSKELSEWSPHEIVWFKEHWEDVLNDLRRIIATKPKAA